MANAETEWEEKKEQKRVVDERHALVLDLAKDFVYGYV